MAFCIGLGLSGELFTSDDGGCFVDVQAKQQVVYAMIHVMDFLYAASLHGCADSGITRMRPDRGWLGNSLHQISCRRLSLSVATSDSAGTITLVSRQHGVTTLVGSRSQSHQRCTITQPGAMRLNSTF